MRKNQPPRPSTPRARADEPAETPSFLGQSIGTLLGPFVRLIAAFLLGAGGIFLIMAWQAAPQKAVDAARYAKYTQQVQGTIVESWVALEVDTAGIRLEENWRASSRATPCALVEYEGSWGPPTRRVFCGDRLPFSTDFAFHDVGELTPGVAFVWARDAAGFAVPEIRLSASARAWLATHGFDTFMHRKWPVKTALDELRVDLDEPVENAVAGWIAPAANMPLAFNPEQPAQALPAGFVAAHQHWHPGTLILAAVIGLMGLAVWFKGITVLVGDGVALPARVIIAVLPLLALPWWGEEFPRALSHLNAQWGSVVTDIVREMQGVDRLLASDPADAPLAGGERLIWQPAQSIYVDTFGRLHYAQPQPAPASADAALAALAQTVTAQTRTLGEDQQIEIFARLERDTEHDLMGAGIVFLPAATQAARDPNSGAALRRAATAFVSARLLAQLGRPNPRNLGYHERERLYENARAVETTP